MRIYPNDIIGLQEISVLFKASIVDPFTQCMFHKINVILEHVYQIKTDGSRNKAYGYTYA